MNATSALRSFLIAVGVLSTVLVGASAAEVFASSDQTTAGISISKKHR